jgi:hypothetical protein
MKSAIFLRNVCPIKVVPVKTHLEPTFGEGRAKVVEVLRVLVGGDEEGDGSARVVRIEVDWETRLDGQSSRTFVVIVERGGSLTRDIAGQGYNVSRTAGIGESTAELNENKREIAGLSDLAFPQTEYRAHFWLLVVVKASGGRIVQGEVGRHGGSRSQRGEQSCRSEHFLRECLCRI